MKKIAAVLLCLCLIAAFPLTAFAQNADGGDTHISTVIPSSHIITVNADGVEVLINGTAAKEFTVDRLSKPTITFKSKSGKQISKVLLNGEDITDEIIDGSYTLEPVYEDIVFSVTTEDYIAPTTEPDATEPTTENPGTTEPDTTEPTTGNADETEPNTTEPTTGNADETESKSTEPTTNPQTGNQGTNPIQTGEVVNTTLWIVLLISFAVVITLSIRHSKKEN